MLEVVIPGTRHGRGVMSGSSAYRGMCCYIAGINADGYQVLKQPYDSAQSAAALYPVNKYRFEEDLSDTSAAVDLIADGAPVIYYEGGEYITDKFNHNSFELTTSAWSVIAGTVTSAYGQRMYTNPGSSTAQASMGANKRVYCGWPDSTSGDGLYGDTSFSHGDKITNAGFNSWIGIAIGIYYEDSANARLHWRSAPGNAGGTFFDYPTFYTG